MRSVENYVAHAEQIINRFDWIPYVSSLSGMVRILAGAVEVAAAIVFTYLKIVHNLLTGRARVGQALEQGYTYSLHGFANIARGVLAMHPWWNLFLALHDWKLGRFNYPEEMMRPGVFPLRTLIPEGSSNYPK